MIALVVATAELALVAVLGSWQRWLIFHGAIAVIFLVVFLARFGQRTRRAGTRANGTGHGNRRGIGGLLGGLLGGRGRGNATSGHRTGGLGGARGHGLGRLFGGHGNGRGIGGRLGGLLGGRGRGTGSPHGRGLGGHGTGSGRSGRGSGLGRLLGGTGTGRSGGHGSGRSGHGSGRSGHGSGWNPFSGNSSHGKGTGTKKGKGGALPGLGFLTRTGQEIKRGWNDAGQGSDDKTHTKPDAESDAELDAEPNVAEPDDAENQAGNARPDTPATTPRGEPDMVKTHGTPSLQAWGRCLPSIESALLEKQREFRRLEGEMDSILQAVARLQDQGENELPASPTLTGLLSDVKASLAKLPKLSDALNQIASNANALGPLYRAKHADDEDRLAGQRGGVEREKRADVGEAQKDT